MRRRFSMLDDRDEEESDRVEKACLQHQTSHTGELSSPTTNLARFASVRPPGQACFGPRRGAKDEHEADPLVSSDLPLRWSRLRLPASCVTNEQLRSRRHGV